MLVLKYTSFFALVVHRCPSDETLAFIPNVDDTTVQFELNSFRFVEDTDKEVCIVHIIMVHHDIYDCCGIK